MWRGRVQTHWWKPEGGMKKRKTAITEQRINLYEGCRQQQSRALQQSIIHQGWADENTTNTLSQTISTSILLWLSAPLQHLYQHYPAFLWLKAQPATSSLLFKTNLSWFAWNRGTKGIQKETNGRKEEISEALYNVSNSWFDHSNISKISPKHMLAQTSNTKLMIDFLLPSPLNKHRSQKEIWI